MTLADLKKEKIEAMKRHDKDSVTALNVVISKLMLLEKSGKSDITELDVVQAIQKAEKELLEEREGFLKAGREETVAALDLQLECIRKYLPKMLSEEEITKVILGLTDRAVPTVMRYFRDNYAGKCDMKQVSEILKKI